MLKIYSGPMSMYSAKVEIAAREKGIRFERLLVPFNLRPGYGPKHPDVLRINPKGQIPLIIDGAVELFDSTQIFEYLEERWPEPPLWPKPISERAQARQLELMSDEVFFPHVISLMRLKGDRNHPDWAAAKAGIGDFYEQMDRMLAKSDYLVGAYSYADIAFYMAQHFAAIMGVPLPSTRAHAIDWRNRMLARGPVRHVTAAMTNYMATQGLPLPDFLRSIAETGLPQGTADQASTPSQDQSRG